MGFFSTLFGRRDRPSASPPTLTTPRGAAPSVKRSAPRLDLPQVFRGLPVQGMYYSRNNLAEIGEGTFDATLGVRHQDALGGEVASHVVTVVVNGREVGWIHRDEHLLGFVRGVLEQGREPHAEVQIQRFSAAEEGREWYASLLIPQLAALKAWAATPEEHRGSLELRAPVEFALNDAKAFQEQLSTARKGRSRKATASIHTEPESTGKYAGQSVYVFTVDGVVIGTRRPRWGVEDVEEAFGLGVREAQIVIEGEPGALTARATMARRPG